MKSAIEWQNYNRPTVGVLIDAGFISYFDFFADGDWSHWIHPEFIGDEAVLGPERPEPILVDHEYWRPFGVMSIATEDGDHIDPPPAVYTDDSEDGGACAPWHAHVGVPGRYAWWKYRASYGEPILFPYRTPWMLHVWKNHHAESIYAYSALEERGGPPAEPSGFETDADPDEEVLGPEHLPDEFGTSGGPLVTGCFDHQQLVLEQFQLKQEIWIIHSFSLCWHVPVSPDDLSDVLVTHRCRS